MVDLVPGGRPSLPVRAAAGAWHVPASFVFLLRRPGLWALAALPAALAVVLVGAGFVAGIFLVPPAVARFAPAPGSAPVWVELPVRLLLATATVGSGVFLGLGIALALASPILDRLSRQVEARARGGAGDSGKGFRWEAAQALRGSLYFLAAAPGVFLLGLIPVVGPFLSLAWGSRALAFQMTDPALTRRGLSFKEKRLWHRAWRAESMGFGLGGMLGLLVPFANLVLGPALVAGGTLLVLDLEDVDAERPRPEADPLAGAGEPGAEGLPSS
jgi:CysZ protein